jgi:hypothetical protein
MIRTERYNTDHFEQLITLFKEHNRVARKDLVNFSYDGMYQSLLDPYVVTYCHFVDNTMTSFMISHCLEELPTWIVRLVCGKKSTFFNPKKVGICALYDSTINYWESKELKNFLYVQPSIFLSAGNSMTRSGSTKLQEYVPYNYCLIKANTTSSFPLIRKIMVDNTFEEDMIARWCFKK